jgi:hypothetical protein
MSSDFFIGRSNIVSAFESTDLEKVFLDLELRLTWFLLPYHWQHLFLGVYLAGHRPIMAQSGLHRPWKSKQFWQSVSIPYKQVPTKRLSPDMIRYWHPRYNLIGLIQLSMSRSLQSVVRWTPHYPEWNDDVDWSKEKSAQMMTFEQCYHWCPAHLMRFSVVLG